MTRTCSALPVAESDGGVLSVVIDAPPMNLIGPEPVPDMIGLPGALEPGQEMGLVVLESADLDYFVPDVDLTKVAPYTAEEAKGAGQMMRSLGMLRDKLSKLPAAAAAWGGEPDV